MRILLVEPPISPYDVPTGVFALPEPLALETVAATLVSDHAVTILDMRLEQERLEPYLEEVQPHVVGVGAVAANLHLAKEVLSKAKAFDPRILTLIGGHHVTLCPDDACDPFIDVIVKGEGDVTTKRIVEAFEQKATFFEAPGIALGRKGDQLVAEHDEFVDMDALELPARDLVKRYRQHYFQRAYRPIISINTSRGCPSRCSFCSQWKVNRGRYRTRSAELVVDEIAGFSEQLVDFIDDNSLEDVARAHRLAELLLERRIRKKLKLYGRADTVAHHPDLIEKLAAAGMEMLLVGFEAVRQDRLEGWNKRTSLETNRRAIEILKSNRIRIISYFVIDPGFDREDFAALWNYVNELELLNPIFTVLVPFPGTDLYERTRASIRYNDYRLYDFFHTVYGTKLPLEEFYEQFALLYEKAYSRERQLAYAPKNIPRALLEGTAQEFLEVLRRIRILSKHHRN